MMNQAKSDIASSYFYLTAEIRWFMRGEVPPEFQDWFNRSKYKQGFGTRTDTYLVYPNAETVGVKFREHRFEIKSFVKTIDQLCIRDHIIGNIEIWEKWSMAGNAVAQLLKGVDQDRSVWIEVKKTRTIRKYSTDGEEVVEIDSSGKQGFPDDGCFVELTEIIINNNRYWSVGFEAFSEKKTLVDNLLQTVAFFFESAEVEITLSEEDSYSYPTLLGKIRSDQFQF